MVYSNIITEGLYYLKSRYYYLVWGRFLNADSIKYLNPKSIIGLNLFTYCGNNPIMKKMLIIGFIVIILFLILVYVVIEKESKMISVYSYDKNSRVVFGKFNVSEFYTTNKNDKEVVTTFKFKNNKYEKVFLYDLKNSKGFFTYLGIHQYNETDKNQYYYIYSKGYYYILWKDETATYHLKPLYSNYIDQDSGIDITFPFIINYSFNNTNLNEVKCNITYDDFITFYKRLTSSEVTIDKENKAVNLKGYNLSEKNKTDMKSIEVTWTEDKILIKYINKN